MGARGEDQTPPPQQSTTTLLVNIANHSQHHFGPKKLHIGLSAVFIMFCVSSVPSFLSTFFHFYHASRPPKLFSLFSELIVALALRACSHRWSPVVA